MIMIFVAAGLWGSSWLARRFRRPRLRKRLFLVNAGDRRNPGGWRRVALVLPPQHLDQAAERKEQDGGGQEYTDIMVPLAQGAKGSAFHAPPYGSKSRPDKPAQDIRRS